MITEEPRRQNSQGACKHAEKSCLVQPNMQQDAVKCTPELKSTNNESAILLWFYLPELIKKWNDNEIHKI